MILPVPLQSVHGTPIIMLSSIMGFKSVSIDTCSSSSLSVGMPSMYPAFSKVLPSGVFGLSSVMLML